jgi:hypothetical protein
MPPTHAPALSLRSVFRPALPIAVAALAALVGSSCSPIGMQRLEADLPAGAQPECTSTWTMPLIDMGLAVIAGSTAVGLLAAASNENNDNRGGFRVAGWSIVGVSLGFIASGSYGAYQRSRCRKAEVAFEGAGEPAFLREGRPLKGAAGSSCQKDEDCDEDLLCGVPMKTCVPANAPESPTP